MMWLITSPRVMPAKRPCLSALLTLASVTNVEMVLKMIGSTPKTARGTPIYVMMSVAETDMVKERSSCLGALEHAKTQDPLLRLERIYRTNGRERLVSRCEQKTATVYRSSWPSHRYIRCVYMHEQRAKGHRSKSQWRLTR